MRELERELVPMPTSDSPIVLVGRGRVGRSLAAAFEAAGLPVRLCPTTDASAECAGASAALLCVPDDAIAEACERVASASPPPRLVGHVSGASTLEALSAATAGGSTAFSLHPLQTFADDETDVAGVPAAVAGSDPRAEAFAAALADGLGMRPFAVPEERRAAYHAAACIASNFLVALEESAAGLLAEAGIEDGRELLAPLVLRTAANWAEQGGEALTGPIARGDKATVERHRAALAEIAPELLPAYEALAERTEALAREGATA
jgi:predicted short-subunit dehydrogenase-like oxidoreductase (DUF2520 family)